MFLLENDMFCFVEYPVMQKAISDMQSLQSQLSENTMVMEELQSLGESSKVYKLVGPVMIPQELEEAKSTVDTRIKFIRNEVSRSENKVQSLEKSQEQAQKTLLKSQQELQRDVQALATKADPAGVAGR